MDQCFCKYLYTCAHCEAQTERQAERRVCRNWNWNYSPAECAAEAIELGWDIARVVAAMKDFGFSAANINQVVDAFDVQQMQ